MLDALAPVGLERNPNTKDQNLRPDRKAKVKVMRYIAYVSI